METDPGLIRFMLDPAHYPEPSTSVAHIETHISHVFLCDDFVYKLKKPVDFGFLDFTTLRKRRFFCDREVTLNSRLAGHIYLGVTPVYRKGADYSFEGTRGSRIAEYVVRMRRIPMDCLLFGLIGEGRPLFGRLESVGRLLARFHRDAGIFRGGRYGGYNTVAGAAEENFSQIEPYQGETVTPEFFHGLTEYTREFLKENRPLFSLRKKGGFVRDGHGDLHSQHICLASPPVIFDCIEFNESFRIADVLEDIAFLFMDLEYQARFDLSSALSKTYFAHNEPVMNDELLRFYKIYRAVVRGKVEGFRFRTLSDGDEKEKSLRDSREYFHLAEYYLNFHRRPFNPVVFMGLSGAGKSTIARDFSAGWLMLRSDEVRKAMTGVGRGEHRYERFGEGIYSEALTSELYCSLLGKTVDAARKGKRIVVDATFLKKNQRRYFYETCVRKGLNPFFVHCFAEESTLRERIRKRVEEGTDVSDAHMSVLDRQLLDMEEPEELPYYRVLRLNTEEKLHDINSALKEFL